MIGPTVQVTAKVDYAVRAMVELAAADGGSVKGEAIATAQGVPFRFLENILLELRHARLVRSQRGSEGGYRLARPAETITIADVIRTVDGPIASIRSERPDELTYSGAAASLQDVWVAASRQHARRAGVGHPRRRGQGRAPRRDPAPDPAARGLGTALGTGSRASAGTAGTGR